MHYMGDFRLFFSFLWVRFLPMHLICLSVSTVWCSCSDFSCTVKANIVYLLFAVLTTTRLQDVDFAWMNAGCNGSFTWFEGVSSPGLQVSRCFSGAVFSDLSGAKSDLAFIGRQKLYPMPFSHRIDSCTMYLVLTVDSFKSSSRPPGHAYPQTFLSFKPKFNTFRSPYYLLKCTIFTNKRVSEMFNKSHGVTKWAKILTNIVQFTWRTHRPLTGLKLMLGSIPPQH